MTKIAVIGPESCGKTTLCKELGRRFGAVVVEEYARTYLQQREKENGGRYVYSKEDVEHIARVQIQQLDDVYPTDIVLFDTELIVTQVWFEYKYGEVPAFLTKALAHNSVNCYLLCAPDLPFEPDPLRENPHIREELFERYRQLVSQQNKPCRIVRGEGNERVQIAERQIREWLNTL